MLKKHWRREGKNEVIGRKPTRKGSVTVTSDHNDDLAKPSMIAVGCVRVFLLLGSPVEISSISGSNPFWVHRIYSLRSSATRDVQLVRVDDACLVVFPVVFGIFHVVYWTTCLSHQPETFSWIALMKNPETASEFMFD